MSRRDDPSAMLEDRAPHARRSPARVVLHAIALALLCGVLGWTLFVVRRGSAVLESAVVVSAVPSQSPPQSQLIPGEGIELRLQQRESQWFAGRRMKLSIGDITSRQVNLEITDSAGNVLLAGRSVREEDVMRFADPEGAPLQIEVIQLTNNLIGEDFGTFKVLRAAPATQPGNASSATSRSALSEPQKIELLLARIRSTEDARFIRNGEEHSAGDAAEHLLMKWTRAGGPQNSKATAADFIEQVGTRSSLSGEEYRIRLSGGRLFLVPSGCASSLRKLSPARWGRRGLQRCLDERVLSCRVSP